MSVGQRDLLPPRVLPWLYFGSAHISLVLALAAIAWDPRAAGGFFYHARLAGIVHLVTIGWITMSILGSLYLVGPLALRMPMRAGRVDAAAFALVVIGLIGMVAHFWIEEFGGMAWSGAMVACGIVLVGYRALGALRVAPVPPAVKLHIRLAFANITCASAAGVLLGFDKVHHFLPGFVLSNVVAHAHLAAVGWASMMVAGVAYRLLPMVLPARMPSGPGMYLSAVFLEAGAAGLFVTIALRSTWTAAFAVVVALGFVALLAHVVPMLKNRRTPASSLPPVDYAVYHVGAAFAFLLLTLALGTALAIAEPSDITMRAALVYGVFGLIGFLSQIVAGMQLRLLPWLAWYTAAHRADSPEDMPPMARLASAPLAGAAWVLWLWGVPALAAGFFFNAIPLLTAGAVALEAAALIGAARALRLALCGLGPMSVPSLSGRPMALWALQKGRATDGQACP
jgi:hypothetical protein